MFMNAKKILALVMRNKSDKNLITLLIQTKGKQSMLDERIMDNRVLNLKQSYTLEPSLRGRHHHPGTKGKRSMLDERIMDGHQMRRWGWLDNRHHVMLVHPWWRLISSVESSGEAL